MAEKQTNKDRMREIVDSIENGIKELFESDKYRQYLSTMSRFHRYSVNNTMLIYMQRPDATHVAGFNKWRDQFGRNVLKGEKGIRIIAPTPYKKKVEEIKTDPETNAPVLDADGKAIIEEKEIRIPMFKVVSVFDVSQTAGKPLPQLAADLSGNVQQYEVFMEALRRAKTMEHVAVKGLHCHIGSQILEKAPFVHAAEVMLQFYAKVRDELGMAFEHLNLGGGFGIHYTAQDDAIPYEEYMEDVSAMVHSTCEKLDLELPRIYIEPGRSIVGEAGITLYTVGSIKEIPGVRTYVAIDGGMFDNPRYALYQSAYTCCIANKASQPADFTATIAGKCCESGDLIQEHTLIQKPEEGDILAVLSTGAYNYSMASNYNRNLKPACVMVSKGESRIVIKGETYEDLIRNDV